MDKKIVLPEKALTEGMPCHKFILRQLSNANDAKTFVKNYVSVMVSAGMERQDIETSLVFMSSIASRLGGIYRFDAWDYSIEGFDLIDNIIMDNSVAVYKSCKQYYRKFDVKATACALCPLSSAYKNKRKECEAAVIRYCLESRDNFEYILSKNITAELFCAVVDVTENKAAAERPCIYPFYKRTFELLMLSDYACDLFDEGIDYEIVLEKFHTSKVARFSGIVKDCSTTVNTFCAVMISEHLPKAACSSAEIDNYINQLLPGEVSDMSISRLMDSADFSSDGVFTGSKCNMGLDNMASFYDARKDKDKKNRRKVESVKDVNDTGEDVFLGSMIELSLSSVLSNIDYAGEAEVEPPDNVGRSTWSSVQEVVEQPLDRLQLPMPYRTWSVSRYYRNVFEKSGMGAEDGPVMNIREIRLEDSCKFVEADSRVCVPLVNMAELEHFSLNLDNNDSHLLSLFESHVLKDKRLSIELVLVDEKCFLLMYSPKLHAYFHSACADDVVKGVISELLSYSSVTKFCYSPYMLVGMMRRFGMRVKNLWSLYSMSSLLYRNHREPMESMLEKMGAAVAVGGVTVRAVGDITSVALKYMHCYHNLFYRNKRTLLKRGLYNAYEEQNMFDLALSLSYLQAVYASDVSYLFKLSGAGNYVFRGTAPTTFKVPGKSYCIFFRHSPERISHVIVLLICELYREGLFDKGQLMLIGLGETFFSYFVGNRDREYLELRINRFLLKYLKQSELHGIEYSQSELVNGRVYPEHTD